MARRCPSCGANDLGEGIFCGACGVVLRPVIDGIQIQHVRIGGPIVQRERQAPIHVSPLNVMQTVPPAHEARERCSFRASGRATLIATTGFFFTIIFLIGLTEFIEVGGLPRFGLWPAGVFIGGELLAQEAWVKGNLKIGLPGMICCCLLIWLSAASHVLP
jgi:hypothetical protein